MEKMQIVKKIAKITVNVVMYLFIAICIFSVVLTITSKKDVDGAVTVFGIQMRTVLTASMEECKDTDTSDYDIKDIPVGSMIFIETVPKNEEEANKWYSKLKEGDVLTFRYVYVRQETITHRIVDVEYPNANGGYTFILEGDNKGADAETLTQTIDTTQRNSPNYIIGKVTGQSYLLGKFVGALKAPVGLIFIVILPCSIIVVFEILKIVRVFAADKRKRAEAEREEKENELLELKRRLAELEAEKNGSDSSDNKA